MQAYIWDGWTCNNYTYVIGSFQCILYRGFIVSRNSFGRPRTNNSYTTEDKSLVLAKQNQRKRSKHSNRTVNLQAFVKTEINNNTSVFFSIRYIDH